MGSQTTDSIKNKVTLEIDTDTKVTLEIDTDTSKEEVTVQMNEAWKLTKSKIKKAQRN